MGILDGLNEKQQNAAQDLEGPVLILAGAGSGKTRTLTHRVAWILSRDKAPAERVLVVTFTNRAARELRDRLEGLLGDEAEKVWAMTFHALCLRILRKSGPVVGVPNDFTVLDVSDTRKLLQEAAEELDDPAGDSADEMRKVRALISRAKNAGQGPEALSGPLGQKAAALWRVYERRCQELGALDFDDLLLKARDLLRTEHGQLNWAGRFRYVMVDEYQDVNRVQEELLSALCQESRNLCVVGDDSQSVYAFRGAEVEHILSFQKRWPDATTHKLEDNYRSSGAILEAAQAIIERSRNRSDKQLVATLPKGPPVRVFRFETHWDEARFIGDRIRQLLTEGVQEEEIAVAYRTNAQSQAIEEVLAQRSVAYQVIGGVSFMRRAEIQNARAYLALLSNPRDRLALDRAAGFPKRGLGPATLKQVAERAAGADLIEAAREMLKEGKLKGKAAKGMEELLAVLDCAKGRMDQPLEQVLKKLLAESGFLGAIRKDKQTATERLANLDGLQELAERYEGPCSEVLVEWLSDTALDLGPEDSSPGVKLMTLHATKGLEFRYVFLVGLEEDLFMRGEATAKQLEEERRLLYVGMTRAEFELVMSMADQRRQWGQDRATRPLQFLFDLPPSVVHKKAHSKSGKPKTERQRPDEAAYRPPRPRPRPPKRPAADGSASASLFPTGSKVSHAKFGAGIVTGSSGGKVEVVFSGKKVVLDPAFARLKLL